jgi:hypothetical protein
VVKQGQRCTMQTSYVRMLQPRSEERNLILREWEIPPKRDGVGRRTKQFHPLDTGDQNLVLISDHARVSLRVFRCRVGGDAEL